MMADFNYNYIYGELPTEEYQEYGVHADNVIGPVPLTYDQHTYIIQITGVTSFESNGTTFYTYNVYEVPFFSFYDYSAYDYSIEVDADNYASNVAHEDESVAEEYYEDSSFESHSVPSDVPSGSDTQDINAHNEAIVLEQSMGVHENDLNEDSEEHPFVYETNQELECSSHKDDDKKEDDGEEEIFIYEENQILDWTVEVEDDDIIEDDNEEEIFVYQKNPLLDWTAEVEDDDIEEDDEDSIKVNSSTIKYLKEQLYLEALSGYMNRKESIPVVDILPVIEEEDVEEHDTAEWTTDNLKEEVEIVSSVIENSIVHDLTFNTSEPFINNCALESAVEDLEQEKEKNPIITETDSVSDQTSESILETPALESTLRDLEQGKLKIPNLIDKDPTSIPGINLSEQNLFDSEHRTTRIDEIINNEDQFPVKETKLFSSKEYSTSQTSRVESELIVEKGVRATGTYYSFNAAFQMPDIDQHEKEKLPELQNNAIKKEDQIIETETEPLDSNDGMLLKPGEEVEHKNEVVLNPVERNRVYNTTYHVPQAMEPHNERYSQANEEKTVEFNQKGSRKRNKKKFKNFRKWLSNLFCCAKKKTN